MLAGTGLAVAGYVVFSLFISGPEIARRTIEIKEEWPRICRATIVADVKQKSGPERSMPRIDMCQLIFGHYGANGQDYCAMHGNFWNGPMDRLGDALDQKKRKLDDWRTGIAIEKSNDRCSCASNLTIEQNRTNFALYAGSARLITPPVIRDLKSTLKRALASSDCKMKG